MVTTPYNYSSPAKCGKNARPDGEILNIELNRLAVEGALRIDAVTSVSLKPIQCIIVAPAEETGTRYNPLYMCQS